MLGINPISSQPTFLVFREYKAKNAYKRIYILPTFDSKQSLVEHHRQKNSTTLYTSLILFPVLLHILRKFKEIAELGEPGLSLLGW